MSRSALVSGQQQLEGFHTKMTYYTVKQKARLSGNEQAVQEYSIAAEVELVTLCAVITKR